MRGAFIAVCSTCVLSLARLGYTKAVKPRPGLCKLKRVGHFLPRPASRHTSKQRANAACSVRVPLSSLLVQRDQWDTSWGPKIVSRCGGGRGHRAAAPVESCQSLPGRCPWGRLGSVLYTCKRLRRIRRRFKHSWPISLSSPRRNSNFLPWFAFRALREH